MKIFLESTFLCSELIFPIKIVFAWLLENNKIFIRSKNRFANLLSIGARENFGIFEEKDKHFG